MAKCEFGQAQQKTAGLLKKYWQTAKRSESPSVLERRGRGDKGGQKVGWDEKGLQPLLLLLRAAPLHPRSSLPSTPSPSSPFSSLHLCAPWLQGFLPFSLLAGKVFWFLIFSASLPKLHSPQLGGGGGRDGGTWSHSLIILMKPRKSH